MKLNNYKAVGNLTRDPELKYAGNGTAILSLGIAIDDSYKNQQGEWINKAIFLDLSVFGKYAESLNGRLSKGDNVFIDGKLKYEEWNDQATGQKRNKISVNVDSIQLTQKKESNQEMQQGQYSQVSQPRRPPVMQAYQTEVEDNMPF